MSKFGAAILVASLLCCASIGQASIITAFLNPDDAAVTCTTAWDAAAAALTVTGKQSLGYASLSGAITTDTAVDPILKVTNEVDNDCAFTWTGYTIRVKMDRAFTISALNLLTPADWAGTITQQPVLDGTRYVGTIDLAAGTPVAIGDTLGFSYKITFEGAQAYAFCQEFTPTPEPGTLALLAVGAIGLVARRRRAQ
jgi:hypothetical protein